MMVAYRGLVPRRIVFVALSAVAATTIAVSGSQAESLYGAMAKAYVNNPDLGNARAALRIIDEGVPQALSGWRPDVSVVGNAGKRHSDTSVSDSQNLTPLSGSLQLTQSLYPTFPG